MLQFVDNNTLEEIVAPSDCDSEFIPMWLADSKTCSFYIGDKDEIKQKVRDFIQGTHVCIIDREFLHNYLNTISYIVDMYKHLYKAPHNDWELLKNYFDSDDENIRIKISYNYNDSGDSSRYVKMSSGDPNIKEFRRLLVPNVSCIRITKTFNNEYIIKIMVVNNWVESIQSKYNKLEVAKMKDVLNKILNEKNDLTKEEKAIEFGIKYDLMLRNNDIDLEKLVNEAECEDLINYIEYGRKISKDVLNKTPIMDKTKKISSEKVKEMYKKYLVNQKKDENTIYKYTRVLEDTKVIDKLKEIIGFKYNNFYEILNVNELGIVNEKIIKVKNNEELEKINSIKHNDLTSSLSQYINFVNSLFNYNVIYYGVPGVGKSYEIDRLKQDFEKYEKTVFHPEYTNADFVGQILPQKEKDKPIDYKFVAGPFTRILTEAIKNIDDKSKKYMLVVEEINRGNAAAIFGEVFQLLDRDDDGFSKYAISNSDIAKFIRDQIANDLDWKKVWKENYKKYIKDENIEDNDLEDKVKDLVFIPNNLYIYATMNTSDQNVYTLDTAFQRRWSMVMMPIEYDSEDPNVNKQLDLTIDGSNELKWKEFIKTINGIISNKMKDMVSTEDKRLGPFFAKENEIKDKNVFVQKVIKYLWDDAFKLSKADGDIFNKDLKSFDDIVMKVKKNELNIEDIFDSTLKAKFVKDGTNASTNKTEV